MSNETMINPINNTNSTVINPDLQHSNATVINAEISNLSDIAEGTTLCEKYTVVNKLDINTGEADLYVCDYNDEKFIAKIYRRKFAVKPEVTNILKEIDSPYIAKLYETGTINGMPFEILPYYKNGSIKGRKFTCEELKNNIIPCINAGLKALHDKEIIHKDLKPSNIMLCDNGKDVAIIDFGISSVLQDGNTVLVTKTGMTPEYSAPETFRNLFLEESDYYSFGVTVCEMFCGYSPYANMSQEEIEQYVSVQRIPMPKNMPTELADFINALTYYDITNRKNKDNPNRRWTYEEVRNWCSGKKQTIPGESTGNSRVDIKPYNFNGKDFTDTHSLVVELATHWDDGKKELFRGYLAPHFANSSNQKCARVCGDAEEDARKGTNSDDLIFWRTIYKLAPELKTFYWKGKSFENLPELGRSMLEKLRKNDKSDYPFYGDILNGKLLSLYVDMHWNNNLDLKQAAINMENYYKVEDSCEKVYWHVAYLLSGETEYKVGELSFNNIEQFLEYIEEYSGDPKKLYLAIKEKNVEKVRIILANGANPNHIEKMGNVNVPILNSAICHSNAETVKLLLENGANPNSERIFDDGRRFSALNDSVYEWPNYEIAKILIKAKADVNYVGRNESVNIPVLNSAICQGNLEIVKLLLENGANPNSERIFDDGKRYSALRDSVLQWPNEEITKVLIEYGAEVNYIGRSADVNSPVLNGAICKGNAKIVKILLENGANPNSERILDDGRRFSALRDSIIEWPNDEIAKMLVEAGADVNYVERNVSINIPVLNSAICQGNLEIVKMLLKNGANSNSERIFDNGDRFSALRDSVLQWPNEEITKILIEYGAEVNYIGRSADVNSPVLNGAICKGNAKVVKMLLENGANPNSERVFDDGRRFSALHDSIIQWPNDEMTEMLAITCKTMPTDIEGQKLLSHNFSAEAVKKLKKAGCKFSWFGF